MKYKLEMEYSPVSLGYFLITNVMLGISIICSGAGFKALKEFVSSLVENFDIHITMKNLLEIALNDRVELSFFLLIMIQVSYISRIVGKFLEDETYVDKLFMFFGSTSLSCFLSIAYALYPIKLLQSVIGFFPFLIWVGAGLIYGLIRIIPGMNKRWAPYTLMFKWMIYFWINPITLGGLCVLVPTFLSVQIYAWLYDVVLYKNIGLMIITVLLISYPLNKLSGRLMDFLLEVVNATYAYIADIFYGIFSVSLIIAWFVLMIFKTEYTDITFTLDDEKYVYKAIKTIDSGIEDENIWWGYFKDGTLLIDGQSEIKNYGFNNSPWYKYRDKIKRIVVLDGIPNIGACAFCGLYNVKEIYISKDVKEISDMVFLDCKSLEQINIDENNSVYSTVDGALYNKDKTVLLICPEGKEYIELPETVETIEEDFCQNNILKEINVRKDNKSFSSKEGILYNKSGTELIRCPIGKKGECIIDNNTKKIKSNAFMYCRNLQSIILSDKLEQIGYGGFAGCKKIKKIVIPKTVKKIEREAFMDCEDLSEVVFQGNPEEIGDDIFLRSNPKIVKLH